MTLATTLLPEAPTASRAAAASWRTIRRATDLLSLLVVAGAAAACVHVAKAIDLGAATDLGVIGLLPGTYWWGLAIVACVFAINLYRASTPDWLYAATVAALITAVFGLSAFASDIPRGNVAWRHAGIVDYLARMGGPDVSIDAYFSWPGFFMLGALFSESTGVSTPVALTRWAPLYTNLLLLPALLLLMRSCTSHRPTQWLAVWVYFLAQWVGQDYFAPQTYTYLLYLVVTASLLAWFAQRVSRGPRPGRAARIRQRLSTWSVRELPRLPSPTGWRRGGLFLVVVLLAVVAIPSHQLTPFAMLISIGLLALVHGRTALVLALVVAAGTAAWMAFMSSAYMAGHLEPMLSEFLNFRVAAEENVGERVSGSPGHVTVVRARIALTVGVVVLASLGLVRRWRHGHRDVVPVLLAGGAFALLPMQPYGGEMLLRCYFFALPFLALLAASAVYPTASRQAQAWRKATAVLLLTAVLLPTLFLTRYGNARIEQFTRAEVFAVQRAYEIADPGTLLFAVSTNVPWKFTEYEQHRTHILWRMWEDRPDAIDLARQVNFLAEANPEGALLVTGQSQEAYLEMFGGMPVEAVDEVCEVLADSHGWDEVHRDGTSVVLASPEAGSDAP